MPSDNLQFEFSKITPETLLAFDGFKQGFEITFTERAGAFSLNDFKEKGRAVFNRLGENLQQITFIVSVNENAELFQRIDIFINCSDTLLQRIVIGGGYREKINTSANQIRNCFNDIVGDNGDVLNPRALIEF
jgi:hypothetical protein